jgi:hypothetical protein
MGMQWLAWDKISKNKKRVNTGHYFTVIVHWKVVTCIEKLSDALISNNDNKPKRSTGENTMKKLFTTVALVALVATPVLAQQTRDRAPQRARADAPQTYTTQVQQQRSSANRANDVYDIRGQRVGSDPDPAIRAQLANDPTQAGDWRLIAPRRQRAVLSSSLCIPI